MKKIITSLLALFVLLCMVSCGQKEEAAPETPEVVAVSVPEELTGEYHEEIAGRGALAVLTDKVYIDWSSSASEKMHCEFPVSYDAEKNVITYKDGKRTDTVFESDSKSTVTVVYEDGSGYFEIADGKLIWHDDKKDSSDTSTFVRNEEPIDMVNPWTYTSDIEEAIKGSGIEFDPPVGLPEGFTLVNYGCNINGIIEATYESSDRKLVVRKSDKYEGIELAGDYNLYSKNWQHSFKGLEANLYGDGETVNLALFGNNSAHYSVNVTDKENNIAEGNGITLDELASLIYGMQ